MKDAGMRALIEHRDFLAERLAATERRLKGAVLSWSDEKGYRVPPRLEAVRREVQA